jgi:hypothetical protein
LYVCYRVTVVKTFRVLLSVSPSFGKKVKLADEQVDRFSGVTDRGTVRGLVVFPFINSRVRFPCTPKELWL